MLKVDSIEFIDSDKYRSYIIQNHQIEEFPFVGGESAEMITTKVWYRHGNTPVNALMESVDGQIVFALNISNKTELEIEEARREIVNICNPLNGTIKMKVTFNSGSVYYRDITFTNAPMFPIGLENRNGIWQKVSLMFTVNDPFWYTDEILVESNVWNNIIVNSGQIETPVIIEFMGAFANPIIENISAGGYIQFKNLTSQPGDEFLIDTTFGKKRVTINNRNVMNQLDHASSFFNLQVGENKIAFRDDEGTANLPMKFKYKNRFITI